MPYSVGASYFVRCTLYFIVFPSFLLSSFLLFLSQVPVHPELFNNISSNLAQGFPIFPNLCAFSLFSSSSFPSFDLFELFSFFRAVLRFFLSLILYIHMPCIVYRTTKIQTTNYIKMETRAGMPNMFVQSVLTYQH